MLPRRAPVRAWAGALVLAVGMAACGGDGSVNPSTPSGASKLSGTLTVLAASSLTDAFESVAAAFERAHRDVKVSLSFGGSSALAGQITEGAPADVFASADEVTMDKVVAEGLTAAVPISLASNRLQIVVPEGNPDHIRGLTDLLDGDLAVALCAPDVPCGRYALEAFARAGLGRPAAGHEANVRGVLTKVVLGEADAGIVYATDVRSARGVLGIDLAPGDQVPVTISAAVLRSGSNPATAAAFIEFLRGDLAETILEDAGFELP